MRQTSRPAELAEAAGLYTTEVVVTGAVLAVGSAGGWALGVVGPDAPGMPEKGHVLERLSERRCARLARGTLCHGPWQDRSPPRRCQEDGGRSPRVHRSGAACTDGTFP